MATTPSASAAPATDKTEQPNTKQNELQLEAYKILVGLLEHDEVLLWRRSEALLTISGGLLTILGIMLGLVAGKSEVVPVTPALKLIFAAICLMGVVISILWFLIAKRSEAFYDHWYEQLEFLERDYLSPISVFSIADEYFAKRQIKLGNKLIKLDVLSSRIRISQALQLTPIIFGVVWIVIGGFLLSIP